MYLVKCDNCMNKLFKIHSVSVSVLFNWCRNFSFILYSFDYDHVCLVYCNVKKSLGSFYTMLLVSQVSFSDVHLVHWFKSGLVFFVTPSSAVPSLDLPSLAMQ